MRPKKEKNSHKKLLYLAKKISKRKIPNKDWVSQQYREIFHFIEQNRHKPEGV